MQEKPSVTIAAICALLPDDPKAATAQAMTAAAVVSVQAGIRDDAAAAQFRDTLRRVRDAGMGSVVQ